MKRPSFLDLAVPVLFLIALTSCANLTQGVSVFTGVEAGPIDVKLSVDENGRVSISGGFSPRLQMGLGPIALNAGIQKTLELTADTPYSLYILWMDSSGEIQRQQYEIGREFRVLFDQDEVIREIQGRNDSVIIVVQRPNLSTGASGASAISCLPTSHSFLGRGWSSAATFLRTETGAVKVFSHCPPMATIQYNAIAVDDEIERVELICGQRVVDITERFAPYKASNNILLHWRSSRIELTDDCRIDFTIRDTQGDRIGLMIKESEP